MTRSTPGTRMAKSFAPVTVNNSSFLKLLRYLRIAEFGVRITEIERKIVDLLTAFPRRHCRRAAMHGTHLRSSSRIPWV
ncbi:MAG: hypothetical protein II670_10600 [Alphaproteobacteria bacterium]|nr:hypothetical protein [Alphaproteobacteria bacterium]